MVGKTQILALAVLCATASAHTEHKEKKHEAKKKKEDEMYTHGNGEAAEAKDLANLPKELDWCDHHDGNNYCTASWNQHIPKYCGACWVHGSLSAAQDRIEIMHRKAGFKGASVQLARQDMLNCARELGYGGGCDGGDPKDVFEYMARYGLPDSTCNNFVAQNNKCDPLGRCQNCMPAGEDLNDFECFPVKDFTTYYVKEYGNVYGEAAIMSEIEKNGPVVCNIACPDNFVYTYHGGIYSDLTDSQDVDHDVEVVGWGEEDGVKFWRIRNSWGSYWGEGGFFRIVRGDDTLKLESSGCTFPVMDLSDEERTASGRMRGSMYGLVPAELDSEYSMPFNAYQKEFLMNPVQKLPAYLAGDKSLSPDERAAAEVAAKGGRKHGPEAAVQMLKDLQQAQAANAVAPALGASSSSSAGWLLGGAAVLGLGLYARSVQAKRKSEYDQL